MLQRLCEQQPAVCAVLHGHRELLHLEHSPEEWRLLEDLCEIMEPFKDATTYLSGENYPTLSALGPLLTQIQNKFVSDPGDICSAAIRAVKAAITSDLCTRYQNADVRMLMNKCTLLDPRLKSLAHLTEDEQEATVNSIVDEIVLYSYNPVTINSSSRSTETAPPSPKKKCVLEKLLGSTFSQTAENSSLYFLCH